MFRYGPKYQALADKFAKAHGDGEWIGAEYMGRHRQVLPPPGDSNRNWMVFRPIWKDNEERLLGVTQYILIEEEAIVLFSSIYDLLQNPFEAEVNRVIIDSYDSPNVLSYLE